MLVKENGWWLNLVDCLNHVYLVHALTFLISFDISFDFEMKREKEKKFTYFKKKRKKKKFDKHLPRPLDSKFLMS